MELPKRERQDIFLPDGAFRERINALREIPDAGELTIGIVYAFDMRTHMLPFWYADKRMAPCSVRLIGDVLHDAGFTIGLFDRLHADAAVDEFPVLGLRGGVEDAQHFQAAGHALRALLDQVAHEGRQFRSIRQRSAAGGLRRMTD